MEIENIPVINEKRITEDVEYKLVPLTSFEAFYKRKDGRKDSIIRNSKWGLKIEVDYQLRQGSELIKVVEHKINEVVFKVQGAWPSN